MIARAHEWDVIVIGGGPAGSTGAALLARAGKRVLVLERDKFPRFHIGESLIPYGNDVLRELGLMDKLGPAGFMLKGGAEFALGNASSRQRFYFGRNLPPEYAETYHVDRAKFDQMLLEHARTLGAEVREQARVASLEPGDAGVRVTYDWNGGRHEAGARWLIDASGRTALAGNALGIPKSDLGLPKRLAIFAHFHGVHRPTGEEAGHISVVRLENSWAWFIPLDAERTSVGLVQPLESFRAQKLTPEQSFHSMLAQHTELRFRMQAVQAVTPFHAEGEYTFRFAQAAGPRWLLTGDAAGFIDPIFSSGVMVALNSSSRAAKAILRADKASRALSRSEQRGFTRATKKETNAFLGMIRMFYDRHAFEVFMARSPFAGLPRAVVNVVGGKTQLPWATRWRLWAFYAMCRVQQHHAFVPRLTFVDSMPRSSSTSAALEESIV